MMDKVEAEQCVETAIKALMPAVVHGFWFGIACPSARSQADQVLLKHRGDLEMALSEALRDQSNNLDSWMNMVSLKKGRVDSCLTHCGVSPRHFRPLWQRLRSMAVIACLCGININDPAIQGELIICLVEAEIKQVPAEILCNDAANISSRLLIQQLEASSSSVVSLTSIQHFLCDTKEDLASRRRAAEYFRSVSFGAFDWYQYQACYSFNYVI